MKPDATMTVTLMAVLALGGAAAGQDYEKMLAEAKFPIGEAIARGLKEAKEGTVFEAELEADKGRIVWSLDVAQGGKVFAVVFDAKDGSLVEQEIESEDHSKVAGAAKVTLADAAAAAVKKSPGRAVHARLTMNGEKPEAHVLVSAPGGPVLVVVDALSGAVLKSGPPEGAAVDAGEKDEPAFTDSFGEDDKDLLTTGTNPYFILEPGWFIELSGKKGNDEVVISITVLDATKKIAGVECRAVEEREIVNGQVKESTRDYFVISRRTNNVYYFGEDVDVYKDGKVVNHEGAWLAGENGARYGLFMPGVPLLGARYFQEIAPGVAMDRGEITSLSEKLECPAGKFENVLKVVETSAIEKDVAETNLYARGIGVVMDDDLKLSRYGKAARK